MTYLVNFAHIYVDLHNISDPRFGKECVIGLLVVTSSGFVTSHLASDVSLGNAILNYSTREVSNCPFGRAGRPRVVVTKS